MVDVPSTLPSHRFFEWLSIDHPHNNVHNIRLCRLITQSGALSARELADLRVVDRVSMAARPIPEPALESLLMCLAIFASAVRT